LAQLACLFSVMLLVVLLGFRVRSFWLTDVVLIPTGRESVFMFTSHREGWVELGLSTEWPGPRAGWWTGGARDRGEAGPFKLWAAHRSVYGYGVWLREGQIVLPQGAPGEGVICDASYDAAVQRGYPGMITNGDPRWVMVRGWEIKSRFAHPIALAAMLPVAWCVARQFSFLRRRRRSRDGCCVECGYDLRGSSACCPECGLTRIQ
jgi:hypothetical protein